MCPLKETNNLFRRSVDDQNGDENRASTKASSPTGLLFTALIARHRPMLVNMAARMAPRDGEVRSMHAVDFEAPALVQDVCVMLLVEKMIFESDRHFVGVFKKRLGQRVSKHLKRINKRRELNERNTGHAEL